MFCQEESLAAGGKEEKSVSHFSDMQWFEFASRAIPSAQKALMDGHLSQGCEECRRLSAIWAEIVEINRREPNYNPPLTAVRSAKAMFEPESSWKRLPDVAQIARLIFDSARESALLAIRGSGVSTRQFLHEAAPFTVDLRIDHDAIRKRVRLIGQILNSVEPAKGVADVEIFLLNGESLVSRALANTSGEFDLEFDDQEGNQLFIDVRGDKVIEIKLPNPLGEGRGATAGN